MKILVINAGSSSLKYQLMDPDTQDVLAKGLCERIGIDGRLTHKVPGREDKTFEIAMPTHAEAIASVIDALLSPEYGVIKSASEIDAVGHRVVHGGEAFNGSVLIDEKMMAALEACIPLAPLHNPANITGIKACEAVMGKDVPQVGVFDTAFHQTMPSKAYIYAVPYELYTDNEVRKYGFHGTSHRYVSARAAAMMGRPIEELKIVTCHLGNGSSLCAVDGGKSVDTTMGFTPLDGVPMGTRCGSVDPSIVEYIVNTKKVDVSEAMNILNKKSGVLGISGVSSDFRDLDAAAAQGNERAQLAIDVFCYQVTKSIGACAAAMGGLDAVVFTAGVGENSADLREKITAPLAFLGVKVDHEKNQVRGKETDISADGAAVRTFLIPTNEELVIAQDTAAIVRGL